MLFILSYTVILFSLIIINYVFVVRELKQKINTLEHNTKLMNETIEYNINKVETWKKAIFQYSIDTEDDLLLERIKTYYDDYMFRGIK